MRNRPDGRPDPEMLAIVAAMVFMASGSNTKKAVDNALAICTEVNARYPEDPREKV